MDDLDSLELLSLVSKVASELQNHLGVSDKTLAEFVIAQRSDSDNFDQFRQKLVDFGAPFPPSLIESVDRLVCTLHPKLKKNVQNGIDHQAPSRSIQEKTHVFRGLALPDKEL